MMLYEKYSTVFGFDPPTQNSLFLVTSCKNIALYTWYDYADTKFLTCSSLHHELFKCNLNVLNYNSI